MDQDCPRDLRRHALTARVSSAAPNNVASTWPVLPRPGFQPDEALRQRPDEVGGGGLAVACGVVKQHYPAQMGRGGEQDAKQECEEQGAGVMIHD